MSDVYKQSVDFHRKHRGKISVQPVVEVKDRATLSLAYTPGVAEACRVIAKDPKESFDLTWRGRVVAVVSDGSAVLGLGNIGALAGLPVMEGKAMLFKQFAGVDAVPIVLNTQNNEEIIHTVKLLAPSFGGINLEDITAPRCFVIEEALQDIGIPVFHDDQHGTAIVVAAALHNAAKVVGKPYESLKVVIIGAGAAGLATAKMLLGLECKTNACRRLRDVPSVKDLIIVDSVGAIHKNRSDLNLYKMAISFVSNKQNLEGSAEEVIKGADVVIGLSKPGLITTKMIQSMNEKAIVFAMANPTPEILPDEAKAAGAAVVATGRSDFANQINNVLAFPAIFKAALEMRVPKITTKMKLAAVEALAELVPKPTAEEIIPNPFLPGLADKVSKKIIAKCQ